MHPTSFRRSAVAALALLASAWTASFAIGQTTATNAPGKEVLIPSRITRVPEGNDFNNPDSEFSFQRSQATDHFVLFWAKEYGTDPMANPIENRRFDVAAILKECDRFYDFYVNQLQWVDKETSLATRYKFLIFVIGGDGGTAFGGSIDNKVGAFWTPASRIHRPPYGVVAHELSHSFQALLRADGANTFAGGSIYEMTAQYMLWQVYPEWLTFENYHLNDYLKATHLAFLHEANQYHTAELLEYWSGKHGLPFVGKLWREAQRGEDPVATYQRLTGISQTQFNDEILDAARRFITWDLPRVEKVAARYANQHLTSIVTTNGWYSIAPDKCPQNYGYNAIRLQVPEAGTKLTLDFEGLAGKEGYSQVRANKAGWRYGFLASKADGSRVYGDTFSQSHGTAEFTVPADTKHLWLVVTGAPTEHWAHIPRRRPRPGSPPDASSSASTSEWPYRFKITGTTPDASILRQ